ncbi:hypothetical protein ACQ4PT_041816 [Festuca glaucescens]
MCRCCSASSSSASKGGAREQDRVCTPVIIPYIVILLHVQVRKLVIIPCIAILVMFFFRKKFRYASFSQFDWFLQQLGSHVVSDATDPPAPSTGTTIDKRYSGTVGWSFLWKIEKPTKLGLGTSTMDRKSEDMSDEPGKLPFKLLKNITNNFSPEQKLGSGAFGEVYKGVFKDGRVIAVKKLPFMPRGDNKQFNNEFEHLKRLKHQNIVQLVGFCDEEESVCVPHEGKIIYAVEIHRALCLEFVPNGGLGKFLSEKRLELNWHTRFKIIQGTCHGLKYLHEGSTMHFDLKPDNILLDEKMIPKIADFGLSRLLGEENTIMTMSPLGTIGFLPPEFINKQLISKKYDIFSLGVIIKRIVTGMDHYWDISNMDDRECIEHVHGEDNRRENRTALYKFELPREFLCEITNNFSTEQIVSESAFTTVFKGILLSGEEIAVKRLSGSYILPSDYVFQNKICNLMEVQHENVLQLLGFCCGNSKKLFQHMGRYFLKEEEESYLCHEYPQSGRLDKYIYDESYQFDWSTRFNIIMGICEGLQFLHTELDVPVINTALAPEDILLDSNMVPKLSVCVSSLFSNQYKNSAENALREIGYVAPEYLRRGEISVQSDIYRLGLLILQITTGLGHGRAHVRGWGDKLIKWKYPSLDTTCIGQFKLCIRTALRCTKLNRVSCQKKRERLNKTGRPSIREIVKTLKSAYPGSMLHEHVSLLSVLPKRLHFRLEPKRLNSCLLYLTNNTNERIAFRLAAKTLRIYHTKLPLCSIVPPNCTYTLTITMRDQMKQILYNNEEFLILQCSIAHDEDLKNVDPASVVVFFEKAKEKKTGHEVQEVTLPVVCNPPDVTTSGQIIASQNCEAVLSVDVHPTSQNYRQVLSVDVHPKEPWVLMSNRGGNVLIWNYQKKEAVNSFEVTIDEPVYSAKFIHWKNWLVAGDGYGYIHVYNYDTLEEVGNFEAHETHIMSLAVNPTLSFMLSASDDHLIKLWDWNKGWECMRIFEGHHNSVTQVMFHPKDSVNFASASLDRTVKIWNIFTGKCNITFDEQPNGLLCLQYFEDKQLHYVRQFLIVCSSDGVAKVWDPETHSCVGKLEGRADRVNALYWLPKHELLVTGSLDGTVQTWKPTGTTYRLHNRVGLNLGAVNALGYIKESNRY